MANTEISMSESVLVAIDIGKQKNHLLIQLSKGVKKKLIVRNNLEDFHKLKTLLDETGKPVICGIEATGNYHRAIAFFLQKSGFKVVLISSISLARTREALHNSWDKNDPKDAQVILYMMCHNMSQIFYDPVFNEFHDLQEISKTYYQVSLRKTKLQHSILNHALPLYFPESERYYHSSRAEAFTLLLLTFPCPAAITSLSFEEFLEKAWQIPMRKVAKSAFLRDMYHAAQNSIALPISEDSECIKMFRMVLEDYLAVCRRRKEIEQFASEHLKDHLDYKILNSVPGIGPIIALTVLAEAGNLRRFGHHRQFLKYCGFDLSTQQSGQYRGKSSLSKRGNKRLRCVFWLAGQVAVRQRENSFRYKYENYIKSDPTNSDLKRKALTAVAVKIARTAYALVKNNTLYRPFHEEAIPGGRVRSQKAVGAN